MSMDNAELVRRFAEAFHVALPPEFGFLRDMSDDPVPVYEGGRRPAWLRGNEHCAGVIDRAVQARSTSRQNDYGEAEYQCSLCARWLPITGTSVDHVIDWRQHCARATNRQEFDALYNDLTNLRLVCARCNSSKQTDILFYWADSRKNKLHPVAAKALGQILAVIGDTMGIHADDIPGEDTLAIVDSFVKIASEYMETLRQENRSNAFTVMMAASYILTRLGIYDKIG
jgi:hypothetical protein